MRNKTGFFRLAFDDFSRFFAVLENFDAERKKTAREFKTHRAEAFVLVFSCLGQLSF